MSTTANGNANHSDAGTRAASVLYEIATQLRIDSVQATTAAASGHPTSCASAAEIMAALFFEVMRYDVRLPRAPHNDVFVLSKGHAAPILYAAWAEAGAFPREHLLTRASPLALLTSSASSPCIALRLLPRRANVAAW